MRGKRNPIGYCQRPGVVDDCIDCFDIIHGAHNVGAKGKADQARAIARKAGAAKMPQIEGEAGFLSRPCPACPDLPEHQEVRSGPGRI